MSRRARQSVSKSSAPVVAPAGRSAITVAHAAVGPDRRRGRSGATLVEASITARLLGMRLLTLDAKVALVPADVTVVTPRVREPARRTSTLSSGDSHGHAGSIRHLGLAAAVRNLDEAERLLADVQRHVGS
jgi:hypothetical protein